MISDLAVLAAVLAVTAAAAWCWRARDGQVRLVTERFSTAELAALGATQGATLFVEFTAAGCTACAAALGVLEHVVTDAADAELRVADVSAHPELVRAHRILRAPTVFVVDPRGRVIARSAGVPRADDLRAVLTAASVSAS